MKTCREKLVNLFPKSPFEGFQGLEIQTLHTRHYKTLADKI